MNNIQNFTHKIRKLGLLIALVVIVFFQNPKITYAESVYEDLPMYGTEKSFSVTVSNPKHGNAAPIGSVLIETMPQDFSYAEMIKFDYEIYAYDNCSGEWTSAATTLSAYFKDANTDERIVTVASDSVSVRGNSARKGQTLEIPLTSKLRNYDCSDAVFVISISGSGYISGESSWAAATSGSVSNIMIKKTPQSPYFSGSSGDGNLP